LVNQTMPRASKPLTNTTRVEGCPSAPTVARVMALGSGNCAASACSNQRLNWSSGSAALAVSSSSSRS
jgi:hypothetical protein